MPYYNTTGEQCATRALFTIKANSQDKIILEIFRRYPDLTASECHAKYPNVQVPLTSIRRSITDLTGERYLEKTNSKRIGIYGRSETVYKIINRL